MSLRERLRRARRRYRARPTNARLVAYLRIKGRLGIFDERMAAYYKVDTRVCAGARGFMARAYAAGLVPTSTTGGHHAAGSYHYRAQAADVGLRGHEIGTERGLRKMRRFQRAEYRAWQQGRRGKLIELIGPINHLVVLADHATPLAEGTPLENLHDNHVHGAFA